MARKTPAEQAAETRKHRVAMNAAGYRAATRGELCIPGVLLSKADKDAWRAGWKRYAREQKAVTPCPPPESPDIAKSARPVANAVDPFGPFYVTHAVPRKRVADMLCGAFEGGSSYWYEVVRYITPPARVWYSNPDLGRKPDGPLVWYRHIDTPLNPGGAVIIKSLDKDKINGKTSWRLDLVTIAKGLNSMAAKCPQHFADMVSENDDATTADVFLQCCLFGEVIYG